jgi:hypothetical protein
LQRYVYGGLVEFVAQSIENRTNKLNDAILFVEAIETQSIENAAKNLVQMALDGKYGIKGTNARPQYSTHAPTDFYFSTAFWGYKIKIKYE